MDPFAVTPAESARFASQYATIAPMGGMITGEQAKNYMMQSGLPPMVLAQIW